MDVQFSQDVSSFNLSCHPFTRFSGGADEQEPLRVGARGPLAVERGALDSTHLVLGEVERGFGWEVWCWEDLQGALASHTMMTDMIGHGLKILLAP